MRKKLPYRDSNPGRTLRTLVPTPENIKLTREEKITLTVFEPESYDQDPTRLHLKISSKHVRKKWLYRDSIPGRTIRTKYQTKMKNKWPYGDSNPGRTLRTIVPTHQNIILKCKEKITLPGFEPGSYAQDTRAYTPQNIILKWRKNIDPAGIRTLVVLIGPSRIQYQAKTWGKMILHGFEPGSYAQDLRAYTSKYQVKVSIPVGRVGSLFFSF